MFCNQCGANLLADSKFCSKCGAKVAAGNPNVQNGSSLTDHSRECRGTLTSNLCCECTHFRWTNEQKGETLCTRYNLEGAVVSKEDYSNYEELEKNDKYTKKGFRCLENEDNEKAARLFTKALSIVETGDACFGLACCFSRERDFDEAIDLFEKSKELYEEEGDRRGVTACNSALSDIHNAVRQRRENIDGLFNLGADIISKLFS